ncbi:MAG: hypothetical protein ACRDCW_17910, partial [Sarcina sp.]
ISMGALGCSNASEVEKNIIVKNDVTKEEGKKEKKLTYEKIENPKEYSFSEVFSDGEDFYGLLHTWKEEKVNEKGYEGEFDFQKIEKDNSWVKVENNRIASMYPWKGDFNKDFVGLRKAVEVVIEGEKYISKVLEGVKYYNGEEEKIYKFEKELNENAILTSGLINEKYGFYALRPEEEKNESEQIIEIINVQTDERMKVKNKIEEAIIQSIYLDDFYLVTDNLKLHKLKKDGAELIIENTIDLSKEFDLKVNFNINKVEHIGEEIVIVGAKQPDVVKDEALYSGGSFVIRYNIKTKEKTYIEDKEKIILDYQNGIIQFVSNDLEEATKTGLAKYYIGEIIDNKIVTIGMLDFDSILTIKENEKVVSFKCDFNDKGTEMIISIQKRQGPYESDKHIDEIFRVKIG